MKPSRLQLADSLERAGHKFGKPHLLRQARTIRGYGLTVTAVDTQAGTITLSAIGESVSMAWEPTLAGWSFV